MANLRFEISNWQKTLAPALSRSTGRGRKRVDSKAVESAGEELAGGDDLFEGAGAAPAEADLGAAVALEIFDFDVVFLAGGEVDGAGEFEGGVRSPATDEQLIVDPDAD